MKVIRHSTLWAIVLLLPSAALATETITYTYDAQGRVTQASSAGSVNNGLMTVYTYDLAGNRTNVTVTNSPNNSPPVAGAIVVPLNGFTVIPLTESP